MVLNWVYFVCVWLKKCQTTYKNVFFQDMVQSSIQYSKLSSAKVGFVLSYKCISYNKGQRLTFLSSLEEIISLSDCKLLLISIRKYSKKFNAVIVKNQIYTTGHIVSFIRINELCDPQKRLKAEIVSLWHKQYFVTQGCHRLEKSSLNIYKAKFLNVLNNTCASRRAPTMLT